MPGLHQQRVGASHHWAAWLGAVFLLALVTAAYWPAFSAGFIWDDDTLLIDNPLVKDPGGLRDIWFSFQLADYLPLTLTSFWLEWRLWGGNPAGYHVTNVMLHATGSILLWRVLLRLGVPGAFLAATLFAVHPVCVASVAWIAERKNTLSLVFYLLAAYWYFHFDPRPQVIPGSARASVQPRFYLFALVAFLLALLSKTSTVVLPPVLLLLHWWRQGRITRTHLYRTAPFFALSLVFGLLTVSLQSHRTMELSEIQTGSFLERVLGGGAALWFYVYKSLLPLNLSMIYPRWQVDASSLLWYLPWMAVFGSAAVCWRFRATFGRPILVAIAYFALTLFPVLGFFDMYFLVFSQAADHLQYLSLVGAVTLVAAGLHFVPLPSFRTAGAVALVAAMVALTVAQARVYKDPETLWRDTLNKNPNAWLALVSLGMSVAGQGKHQEAIDYYQKALSLEPRYALAHYNLAVSCAKSGQMDKALLHFEKTVELRPFHAGAHNNLGNILMGRGHLQLATNAFAAAIQHAPFDPMPFSNMGEALANLGQFSEALSYYEKAVALRPDHAEDRYRLASVEAILGRPALAEKQYREALRLKPGWPEAHFNLAIALLNQGQDRAAAAQYEAALALRPDYPDALNNLAWLLATDPDPSLRDGERAVALAEKACQLTDNTNIMVLGTCDAAYAEAGLLDVAMALAQKTRELAISSGQQDLAAAVDRRLTLYQTGQPYHEK